MAWSIVVFLGACSYGVLSTIVKFAYDAGFTVGEVVGSQLLLATIISWLLVLLFKGAKPTKKDWLPLLAVGMTTGLVGIFYYASLQYLSASIAIVILFQFTWIGVLLEALVSKTRPSRDKLLALFLLLVGTVLASGVVTHGAEKISPIGILLGLLSAIAYALFIMFSGRMALHVSAWSRNAVIMSGSLLITWIVFPPRFLINGALPHGLWKYAILLALFVAISILCMNFGVSRIGATLALILGSAELPTAVFMSRFVLRESVGLVQWLGVIIILLGIVVPELSRRKLQRRQEQLP